MFSKIKTFLLELLFPTRCVYCFSFGKILCSSCLDQIYFKNDENFKVAGIKQVLIVADLNQKVVQESIYKFKYSFVQDLGQPLSQLLIEYLQSKSQAHYFMDFDIVVPVPLSKKKFLQRGFNQSEVLAKNVSQYFSWSFANGLIHRKHRFKAQIDLSHQERHDNVQNVFSLESPRSLKGKKILLMDDIVTTGATLSACSKVLKQAGAREVWALVLAKK